jgi:hypothetical protein
MCKGDLVRAAELFRYYDIKVRKVRISGGEPFLHPNIRQLVWTVKKKWRPSEWIRIYSNGTKDMRGLRVEVRSVEEKEDSHVPLMVSPADLGLRPKLGFLRPCLFQDKCGRSLDAFGFAGCIMAPVLGRLFGVKAHHDVPVLLTSPDLCVHCPYTLGDKEYVMLGNKVRRGEIPYPTETYHKALERLKK